MSLVINFTKKFSLRNLLQLESAGLLILLTFILIPYFVKLVLFTTLPLHYYSFDETIVTEISKQDLPKLLDTVKAEPHPLGFYLLIKLLPVHNRNVTTIAITTLSLLLVSLSLTYAHKRKVIEHYGLSLGLILFFSSFGFLQLTSTIKQDSVSFPLLLFFGFTALSILKQKNSSWRNDLLLGHLLVLVLLFFGYIYYFQALLILTGLTFFLKKHRLPRYLLCLQIVIFLCFFFLYGFRQFLLNSSRFTFIGDSFNTLLNALSMHLTALPNNSFISEIPLIAFIFMIFLFIMNAKKDAVRLGFALITSVLIVAAYIGELFVRARYVSFLFLLLSVLAGWGLSSYKLELRRRYLIIASLFFAPALSLYVAASFSISKTGSDLANMTSNYSREEKTGFLADYDIFPPVFKLGYNLNQNVVPVNIFSPRLFEGTYELDRELLKLGGYFRDMEISELKGLLRENRLERYIYFMVIKEKEGYYDPDRLVLKTLSTSCLVEDIVPLSPKQIFFIFEECSFE